MNLSSLKKLIPAAPVKNTDEVGSTEMMALRTKVQTAVDPLVFASADNPTKLVALATLTIDQLQKDLAAEKAAREADKADVEKKANAFYPLINMPLPATNLADPVSNSFRAVLDYIEARKKEVITLTGQRDRCVIVLQSVTARIDLKEPEDFLPVLKAKYEEIPFLRTQLDQKDQQVKMQEVENDRLRARLNELLKNSADIAGGNTSLLGKMTDTLKTSASAIDLTVDQKLKIERVAQDVELGVLRNEYDDFQAILSQIVWLWRPENTVEAQAFRQANASQDWYKKGLELREISPTTPLRVANGPSPRDPNQRFDRDSRPPRNPTPRSGGTGGNPTPPRAANPAPVTTTPPTTPPAPSPTPDPTAPDASPTA